MARKYTPPAATPPSIPLTECREILSRLAHRGQELGSRPSLAEAQLKTWINLVRENLEAGFGSDSQHVYDFLRAGQQTVVVAGWGDQEADWQQIYRNELSAKLAMLSSILEAIEFKLSVAQPAAASPPKPTASTPLDLKSVFIVHGHGDAVKVDVARLLEQLGLKPIILHEQPNAGKTLIEKFEMNAASVSFAVVLLTPDDLGGAQPDKLMPRARQNVILEMGFFIGKLGRSKVCPIYSADVELPSDLFGVAYTPLDPRGAWKLDLARELRAAGFDIDLNKL